MSSLGEHIWERLRAAPDGVVRAVEGLDFPPCALVGVVHKPGP